MFLRRDSLIGLALLCLGGCASPPETAERPEIDLPEHWNGASGPTAAPRPWVAAFDVPALTEWIRLALEQNPDLAATAARLDQAIAEARIAGAERLPAANLGLDGRRQRINTFGPQSTGGIRFEDYGLQLNVSWELDVWGRLRDSQTAALGEIQATEADYRAARQSLAARVAQAWFNLNEARQQLALARETADADAANLDTLESRFKRGLTDGLDLRRVRAQAAASRSDRELRERALDRARRSFERLLGSYPDGDVSTTGELPALPEALPAGLPSSLLERRPDLIAAERRLASAEAELSAARKQRLPAFSLTASGGTASQEFQNLLDENFSVWSLGANLTQPIFQGGRIQANIDRAAALREQAAAAYRATALDAFLEVENALGAEAYLRREYAELSIAAEEATEADALAWERYRNGTTDFLSVLDTRRTAASYRSRALQLRNQILQNRIDLYLALGGPLFQQP